jgi:hypothetical protein
MSRDRQMTESDTERLGKVTFTHGPLMTSRVVGCEAVYNVNGASANSVPCQRVSAPELLLLYPFLVLDPFRPPPNPAPPRCRRRHSGMDSMEDGPFASTPKIIIRAPRVHTHLHVRPSIQSGSALRECQQTRSAVQRDTIVRKTYCEPWVIMYGRRINFELAQRKLL